MGTCIPPVGIVCIFTMHYAHYHSDSCNAHGHHDSHYYDDIVISMYLYRWVVDTIIRGYAIMMIPITIIPHDAINGLDGEYGGY